jgi:hypothetical protein
MFKLRADFLLHVIKKKRGFFNKSQLGYTQHVDTMRQWKTSGYRKERAREREQNQVSFSRARFLWGLEET